MARDWNKTFTFVMDRRVTIEVWEVGLVHLILQLLVVFYVAYNLYAADAWAFSEAPVGAVNGWPEAGRYTEHTGYADLSELSYCNPAAFSYAYDPNTVMDDPQCQIVSPYEVSAKGGDAVQFTTAFVEYRENGWACAAAHNASQWSACVLRNGTVDATLEGGMQCVCSSKRTVYPVGVELMDMAIEHGFQGAMRFAGRSGSSTAPAGTPGAVDTTIYFQNETGGKHTVLSGGAIRLTVGEWVQLATEEGFRLNDANTNLSPDYRPGRAHVYPSFRSAGLSIDLDVRYSNIDPATGRPGYDEQTVFARVDAKATTSTWGDIGPLTHYERYPLAGSADGDHRECH